jgi:energy-converting hydrogenase Eha subunit A
MKPNFIRHTALCGLFTGLALVLVSVVDGLLGFYSTNKFFNLLTYAIPAGGVIWGALQFRNKEAEGFITYGQVVGYGVLAAVFFGVIVAVYTILLVTVIDPSYVERVQVLAAEQLYAAGTLTEQQIDQALEISAKMMRNPGWIFFSGLLGAVLEGVIVSLIAGIFIQRKRPSTPFDTVE